jgi:hypothetical protein
MKPREQTLSSSEKAELGIMKSCEQVIPSSKKSELGIMKYREQIIGPQIRKQNSES